MFLSSSPTGILKHSLKYTKLNFQLLLISTQKYNQLSLCDAVIGRCWAKHGYVTPDVFKHAPEVSVAQDNC